MASKLEEVLDSVSKLEDYFRTQDERTLIMFADLANSTLYKQQRPYVMGLQKTRLHNKIVTKAIEKQGGQVVKYLGDGVLARFDLGEDVHLGFKALNAAIDIQETLSDYNSKITDSLEKIETRIGIALGVVANFYGNDPQGEIVDLAARIQANAKPGQILAQQEVVVQSNLGRIASRIGQIRKWSGNDYISSPVLLTLKGIPSPQPVVEVRWNEHFLGIKKETEYDEYWENYRYEATLFNLQHRNGALEDEFFRIVMDLRYETVLRREEFAFVCVDTVEDLSSAMQDGNLFSRYKLPLRPGIVDSIDQLFTVEFLYVNGILCREQGAKSDRGSGRYFTRNLAGDGISELVGQKVKVWYRVNTIIRKNGNFFSMFTEYPVKGLSMSFDVGSVGIRNLSLVDYFVSQKRPTFVYTPDRIGAKRVEVFIDDWIYPRGGVVFIWELEDGLRAGGA